MIIHRNIQNKLTVVLAGLALLGSSARAEAYPIDCAILLCLAGGWPGSAECTGARAEFIRRITPFPIEPPLQIWRCPMGATFRMPNEGTSRITKHFAALVGPTGPSVQSWPKFGTLANAPIVPAAHVDISGREFDYIRSIKVYHVKNFWTHMDDKSNGNDRCEVAEGGISIGSYDLAGDFSWARARLSDLPSFAQPGFTCPTLGRYRAVTVEWQDYQGNPGYEVVRY